MIIDYFAMATTLPSVLPTGLPRLASLAMQGVPWGPSLMASVGLIPDIRNPSQLVPMSEESAKDFYERLLGICSLFNRMASEGYHFLESGKPTPLLDDFFRFYSPNPEFVDTMRNVALEHLGASTTTQQAPSTVKPSPVQYQPTPGEELRHQVLELTADFGQLSSRHIGNEAVREQMQLLNKIDELLAQWSNNTDPSVTAPLEMLKSLRRSVEIWGERITPKQTLSLPNSYNGIPVVQEDLIRQEYTGSWLPERTAARYDPSRNVILVDPEGIKQSWQRLQSGDFPAGTATPLARLKTLQDYANWCIELEYQRSLAGPRPPNIPARDWNNALIRRADESFLQPYIENAENVIPKDFPTPDRAKIESGQKTSIVTTDKLGDFGDVITFGGTRRFIITGTEVLTHDKLTDPNFIQTLLKSEGASTLNRDLYTPGNWVTYIKPLDPVRESSEVQETTSLPDFIYRLPEEAIRAIENAVDVEQGEARIKDLLSARDEISVIFELAKAGTNPELRLPEGALKWLQDLLMRLQYKIDSNYGRTDLVEARSDLISYIPSTGFQDRVEQSLAQSDATIEVCMDWTSKESLETRKMVREADKAYIPIDISYGLGATDKIIDRIVDTLNQTNATRLNITGNDMSSFFQTFKDPTTGKETQAFKYRQGQLDQFMYEVLSRVINHPGLKTRIESVVTSGQTGIGEAAAKAASMLGIPVTIVVPKDWSLRTFDNKIFTSEEAFRARFEGKELPPASKPTIQATEAINSELLRQALDSNVISISMSDIERVLGEERPVVTEREDDWTVRRSGVITEGRPLTQASEPALGTIPGLIAKQGQTVDSSFAGNILDLIPRGLKTSIIGMEPLAPTGRIVTFPGRSGKYLVVGSRQITEKELNDPLLLQSLSLTEGWTTEQLLQQNLVGKIITYFKRID